ncbi:MAG: outer membrane beta-barrel protein, partial [Pseudomonadota bacterium]
ENRIVAGIEDGFEAQRFGARLERDIGARISGSVEAFYLTTQPTLGSSDDFDGIGFGVELRALLTEQLQARVNLSRDIQTPLNVDALFTKTSTLGADLEYAASERLTFNAAYVYVDRDFSISELPVPTPFNLLEEDRVHTVTASATYQATERLSFTLYGGYEDRNANPDFFDYDGGFVGVTARFRFGRNR